MHSHLAKMLGTYILEARKAKAVTQFKLAQELEFSAQFLGRIEKGEVMIPEPALIKSIQLLNLKKDRIKEIYRASSENVVNDLFRQVQKSNKKKIS